MTPENQQAGRLVADDVAAVAGGRNMADEYVMNSAGSNFIDMDAFVAGPLVHDLSREFDAYWNSEVVYDVARIARSALDTAALRLAFQRRVARAVPPQASEVPADGHVELPQSGAPEVLSPALVSLLNLPYTLERRRPGPCCGPTHACCSTRSRRPKAGTNPRPRSRAP